ncbi:MAG: DUF2378 family protein [Cystobacter sp.]
MMNMIGHREPVIFSQVVESLVQLTGKERFNADLRKRLKAIGVDLDQPLLVAYSVPTWLAMVGVCAELLYSHLPMEQARYRIGYELAEAYGRTTIGGAVFQLFRMCGWKNSLPRISRGLQSGTNFLSAQSQFVEGGSLEMCFEVLPEFHGALGNQPGIDPYFMNGTMDAMMALVGAPFRSGEYQPQKSGLQHTVYLLRRKD